MNNIKEDIFIFFDRLKMFSEYFNDYIEYKKWNYNNKSVKTYNAYSAKILRQTHIIEKGLSLTKPRKGFGVKKIEELLKQMKTYKEGGFDIKGTAYQNAICVLNAYIKYQTSIGYINNELYKKIEMVSRQCCTEHILAGIRYTTKEEMKKEMAIDFEHFFNSRHSIRQFSEKKVEVYDIEKAVKLAMKAPSACNRQASKVYYYSSEEINKNLSNLIAGNTGFENEVSNYLIITSDISAFYDTFERNQFYIEAGMLAMALMEALHYYGVASCPLQNGEYKKVNKQIKAVCGNIPENEKIILFLAIGYYKDNFSYAVSRRKQLSEVLIIN